MLNVMPIATPEVQLGKAAGFLKWEQATDRLDYRPERGCKKGLQGQQAALNWKLGLRLSI